tara:strand:- start:2117 stop:2437 length:321 start_codon:yes stop_codon:yes gene_type:complete
MYQFVGGMYMADETSLLLERLANRLDALIEKQEQIAEDISHIKEAVYNPDKGIFARVKVLEQQIINKGAVRIAQLESTIAITRKIQWTIMGTAVASVTAMLFKDFL